MCQKIVQMMFFNVSHIFYTIKKRRTCNASNDDNLKHLENNDNVVLMTCNDHSTEVNGRAKVCDQREHQATLRPRGRRCEQFVIF